MTHMNNDNNNSNNWLSFSLSPNMKMETHSEPQPLPVNLFHSPPQVNFGAYYGLEEENGLYSPLSIMPLKSDASLCIVEALNSSQSQAMATTLTPKLEDFFGASTLGTHHYESNGREAMDLSLDSIFCHQNPESDQNLLNQLQRSQRHNDLSQHIQTQQYSYYSDPISHQLPAFSNCLQLPTMASNIPEMKSWVSKEYSANKSLEQKIIGYIGEKKGESGFNNGMGNGDLQSLSLSMSPGSQSNCVTGLHQIPPAVTDNVVMDTNKRGLEKIDQKQIVPRKSLDTFGQRTSQYRGVTRHRWTGRYEAHLWDNSVKKEGQNRKGRQVYLGGYDMEEKAARAYDLAAIKYWGPSTHINFPLENYQKEIEDMKSMSRQEYVAHLRRKSSGFSRGASIYRGVTRHHQHGRWQARIGRVAGNKDLYLGTFSTQEEAAEAYDIAAIKFRGLIAVTNFDISRYDVERIMTSNTLLARELAKRNQDKGSTNQASNYNPATPNANIYTENNVPDNAIQQEVEDSTKTGAYLSNSSSMVTSLSSSREGSPDKSSLPSVFGMSPSTSTFINLPTNAVSSWIPIPSGQTRPVLSMSQMPFFAAWEDS